MRIVSMGHAFFSLTMIGLGILGIVRPDYVAIWQPVPKDWPDLASLCAFVSLVCGIGLLWRRMAGVAARALLGYLLLWLLLVRVPGMLLTFNVETWWATCKVAVMAAGAWVLYVWLASAKDKQRFGFAAGNKGLRIAQTLYGLALIPFGLAHFLYLQNTASLVPKWLPWHTFWGYFTGGAFILAGVAIVTGVYARLAAMLSALEIGMFTLMVWVPIVAAGNTNTFQWSETVVSATLTAGAWMVADSYRGTPWLTARNS